MKFLSQEWYDKYEAVVKETLKTKSKVNAELVEVIQNVWGKEGDTFWIYYKVTDGIVEKMEFGKDDKTAPKSQFRCFGHYANFVLVVQGKLAPQKGLMFGKFRIEGSMAQAMEMMPTYMEIINCKRMPGLEF